MLFGWLIVSIVKFDVLLVTASITVLEEIRAHYFPIYFNLSLADITIVYVIPQII